MKRINILFCIFFGFFRFWRLGVFFQLVFHSDSIPQKGEYCLNVDWSEIFWPDENKLHRKARVYENICCICPDFRSFLKSGMHAADLVGMQRWRTLFHFIAGGTIVYILFTNTTLNPLGFGTGLALGQAWLWVRPGFGSGLALGVNRGTAIHWLYFEYRSVRLFTLIVPVATNSSVSSEGQNWINGRVLWS